MIAISVNTLGKKFKLYNSPMGRFLEYLSLGKMTRHTDFWALQDLSFEIPTGTTLGILGQNGSGKSTLLSILAGVLEPSAGSFTINGKVSAILELGSGFHPEFSGRDNVYMYGSIMGLSKEEIDKRFDEIVLFSELGDFIDQPLRTYSSGMIVRLAFSVAVNVDADILIVDEALAVGDAIFQHRCFRKIREMQAAGKTILYVGHDTEAVRNLCTQALLLDGGRVIERGDPNYVVNKYFALIAERERAYAEGNLIEHGEMPGEGYETVYNLVQNLNVAKVVSAEVAPVQVQTVEIQSTPRKVIFAHPPSQINFSVTIDPGSSLAFAIGIMPHVWDKIPQGVKFDIDIFSDGKTYNIFSRVLQPKRNIGDRGWHNFMIPLEKFSGKNVSIIFCTSGSGDDLSYGWSAWGWGKIVIKPNQEVRPDDLITSNNCQELRYGSNKVKIQKVEIFDKDYQEIKNFNSGDFSIIRIRIKILNNNLNGVLSVGYYLNNKYVTLYAMDTWRKKIFNLNSGKNISIIVDFKQKIILGSGIYSITASVSDVNSRNEFQILDRIVDCLFFKVQSEEDFQGIINLNSEIEIH
jgi:ABC-type polysaccharide/polyol phosphate transport system ATPase subunit